MSSKVTKRTILLVTARLFDPLGFVNPIVVRAKIFLQELWLLKVNWDESIPQNLETNWRNFENQLKALNNIRIPRLVLCVGKATTMELHGFADASTRAYGCCIYLRSINEIGDISVHFLAAKSKVAPIRISRSLPCLELCAALLLAKLLAKIHDSLPKPIGGQYLWTDFEIVLDWLSSHSSNWKVYVANRVAEIQQLTAQATWRHVNSKANPADIVSRGMMVDDLPNSIWFSGPEFLRHSMDNWPPSKKRHVSIDDLPERRKVKSILVCYISDSFLSTNYACSDFDRNCRRFAYVFRFYQNLQAKKRNQLVKTGELMPSEIDNAFRSIIWAIQQQEFLEEIQHLDQGKEISNKSSLRQLHFWMSLRNQISNY